MNKLLAALIAGAFATIAVAQSQPQKPTAQERRDAVQSTTQAGSGSSASTANTASQQAMNTKVSQQVSKMSTAEKKAWANEINRQMVNPNNPSGSAAGTAAMQKENVAISKEVAKLSTAEKKAFIEAFEKSGINPDAPSSGGVGAAVKK